MPSNPHPNATMAASSGGVATLVIMILSLVGVAVPPAVAALIATAIVSLVLVIGRKGVKGLIDVIWHGNKGDDAQA